MEITHHIDAMLFIMGRAGAGKGGRFQLIQKFTIHLEEHISKPLLCTVPLPTPTLLFTTKHNC